MWELKGEMLHLRGAPAHGPVQEALPEQPGRDGHADGVAGRVTVLDLEDGQPPRNCPTLRCRSKGASATCYLICHKVTMYVRPPLQSHFQDPMPLAPSLL